jgi:hypothetical protein
MNASSPARRGTPWGHVPQMWSSVPEDLLLPEAALPSQFHDVWHHSRAIAPERALALAVVEQAVIDLEKHRFAKRRRQQRLYMEAYNWVTSGDRSWPYSFVNLCEVLDINPNVLRTRLLGDAAPAVVVERFAAPDEVDEAA